MTPRRPDPPPARRPPAPRRPVIKPAPRKPAATEPATRKPAATKPATTRPAATTPATPRPAEPKPSTPNAAPGLDAVAPDSVTTYTAGRRGLGGPRRPAVVSTGSSERFAERHAARRRVVRRKVYRAAAAVVLVGALAWLLLLSDVLALDPAQVRITGAGTVVAVSDVRAVVAHVAGTPLPRLDTGALRDRVVGVSGVRHARVTRRWPHGLAISLVAREPVAAVPQPAADPATGARGGFILLDTDGYRVGWAAAAPAALPVVTVPIDGKNKRTLDAVLTVLRALPGPLRAEVVTVGASSQDTVQMALHDGATVTWGSASEAALKVAVLQALRAAPQTSGAKGFDVSAPTLPVTR